MLNTKAVMYQFVGVVVSHAAFAHQHIDGITQRRAIIGGGGFGSLFIHRGTNLFIENIQHPFAELFS